MNKNIPTLALLCALALPACSRHDEPTSVKAVVKTERAAHLDAVSQEKTCADGCEDEKAPSGKCADGCEDEKAPSGKCADGCEDEKAPSGKCADGCEDEKEPSGKCTDGCEDEKVGSAEIHLTPEAVRSNGIQLAKAQSHPLVRTLDVPARVAFNAEATAHVGSPLRGRVAQWQVRLGDAVKKGDPLVVIDSPELGEAQADYLQKRAAAKATVAGVELAKAVWERSQGVYEKTRGITLTQVQQRETEYKAALVGQQTAEGAAVAAERKLHLLGMDQAGVDLLATSGELSPRCTLQAPIDGSVVEREATLGEIVGPERESLLVVADLSLLWALAEVPEAQLDGVAVGAKAWIHPPGADSAKVEGVVSFIAPTVDEATRTVRARIEIKGAALRPGSFVAAQIAAPGKSEPVLSIPEEAVQEMRGKTVVFVPVKGEDNTFVPRPVKLGQAVGDWVPVLGGLKEGESFVGSGSFILKAEAAKSTAKGCTDGCGG